MTVDFEKDQQLSRVKYNGECTYTHTIIVVFNGSALLIFLKFLLETIAMFQK